MPPVPRMGLQLAMPSAFDYVKWFGLGPHEAYDDRKSCVYVDSFCAEVPNLHVPYVFPQENGRRASPRWLSIRSTVEGSKPAVRGNGYGILIICDSDRDLNDKRDVRGWGWNASRYSISELASCDHDHDLRGHADGRVYLNVDSKSMGVGGYDSWTPNVANGYLISSEEHTSSLLLLPLLPSEDDYKEIEKVETDLETDLYHDFLSGKYAIMD